MGEFYGIPGIEFIWHNSQTDPECEYKGYRFNYYHLEDPLWEIYREECEENDKEPTPNGFEKWIPKNKDLVYGHADYIIEHGKAFHAKHISVTKPKVKSKGLKPDDYHRYSIRYHGQSIDDIKESDVPYMMRRDLGYREGRQVGGLDVYRSRSPKAKARKGVRR